MRLCKVCGQNLRKADGSCVSSVPLFSETVNKEFCAALGVQSLILSNLLLKLGIVLNGADQQCDHFACKKCSRKIVNCYKLFSELQKTLVVMYTLYTLCRISAPPLGRVGTRDHALRAWSLPATLGGRLFDTVYTGMHSCSNMSLYPHSLLLQQHVSVSAFIFKFFQTILHVYFSRVFYTCNKRVV